MNNLLREQVLQSFKLTSQQNEAAITRGRDIAVTAGAGSGKTSTLVARYVTLLADGLPTRSIFAITFTYKAALEMRARVRETLTQIRNQSTSDDQRQLWNDRIAEMDSARIGTIHSLCSEILRAHPAQAKIDPKFKVMDENNAAALRAQIVEDTKSRMAGMAEFAPLFRVMDLKDISELLTILLNYRLDAQEAFEQRFDVAQVIRQALESNLQKPAIADCISYLRGIGAMELRRDAGDKLAEQVEALLPLWDKAEKALLDGDDITCCQHLFQARRKYLGLQSGKKNSVVKETIKDLREDYKSCLDPICGGEDNKDAPPSAEAEENFIIALDLIQHAFTMMVASYCEALRQQAALDFDDLENGAAQLLARSEIQEHWQSQVAAVLVDEFQDTNQRQRQIVEALAGSPGKLFVVGDAKQSIYRFRRADVTVFRSVQQNIKAKGGVGINLDETFRSHKPMLDAMEDLLSEVMKSEEDPPPPYHAAYQPLIAHRQEPREGIVSPHIEFVIGAGDNTEVGRPAAAQALAARLLELKQEGQIRSWDDVALLFRAANAFPYYEKAFEEAGIPFVTVAGRGFYDRPEIRDVINILRALADPTDDLAMEGMLRWPAFGFTDSALYQLRWQNSDPMPFWPALQGDLSTIAPEDQPRAERALSILHELIPLVDRIPVAELLKKLVDITDYRAILAITDQSGTGGRLWRNLDKLIADAQSSGKINVRDFLDHLTIINDAGAREGEAPADAQGSLRLMTIHKSKGLQFPIVVLADASRENKLNSEPAYLLPNMGIAVKLDPPPILYKIAKSLDKKQTEAEVQRLLYVALTRAQEKLIICGHAAPNKSGEWKTTAWLQDLSAAAQIDVDSLLQNAGSAVIGHTKTGQPMRAWAMNPNAGLTSNEKTAQLPIETEPDMVPIYAPLTEPIQPDVREDELPEVLPYRTTGPADSIPPAVIGKMVHKAIELWLFPEDFRLRPVLRATALTAGLAQPSRLEAAIRHAEVLLNRFHDHPLRIEVEATTERYHELPYTRNVKGVAETGYIDLLYRTNEGWQIIDFKTDAIWNDEKKSELTEKYSSQMNRYAQVINALLGEPAKATLCFLDDHGKIELVSR